MRDEFYSYALENNQSRVYEYFNNYHNLDHSLDICAPEWECEWEECEPNENGDACWMEICDSECDEEQICKTWYAYEYDYSKEEWLWDIQECEKDFEDYADDVEDTLEDTADFIGDNFEGSLGMLQDMVCPDGSCVRESAEMAGQASADIVGQNFKDEETQRAVANGMDEVFYKNSDAVEVTKQMIEDAEDAGVTNKEQTA